MRAGVRDTSVSSGHRGTTTIPKTSRSTSGGTSGGGSTILVNLDIHLIRATIGRDISPEDDDLIVLFRRNSKEVASEPTRWHTDHIATWNQHVGIQTSLLRNKQSPTNEFLPKDYEIVLVALPSHSAVALFSLDFADVVQTQKTNRQKSFRISPTKCRDLAATLEFEVVWDYANSGGPTSSVSLSKQPSSSLSMGGRRTNVSVASIGSMSSEMTSTTTTSEVGSTCSDCRTLRRRMERKEMQIVQLESFLRESQKRIDSLAFENEELLVREQAETKNAGQYRALNFRLLQELEMAFQFCAQQMQQMQATMASPQQTAALFMFLPQFEFMERVKKFHFELDQIYGDDTTTTTTMTTTGTDGLTSRTPAEAWAAFDFRAEMDAALERNQRLQQQLDFLSRSLVFEVVPDKPSGRQPPLPQQQSQHGPTTLPGPPTITRLTSQSTSEYSIGDHLDAESLDASRTPATVRTVAEQLHALERENFQLKAKLETALQTSSSSSTSSSTSGSSEVDQLREDKAALAHELETLRSELAALRPTHRTSSSVSSHASEQPLPSLPLVPITVVPGSSTTTPPSPLLTTTQPSPSPTRGDFFNKIYMDVGKAKIVLEEKVKRLNQALQDAQDDNARLRAQLEEVQQPPLPTTTDDDQVTTKLRTQLEERASQLRVLEQEVAFLKQHLAQKAAELTTREAEYASERTQTNHALSLAHKTIAQLEVQLETLAHEHAEAQRVHQEEQLAAVAAATASASASARAKAAAEAATVAAAVAATPPPPPPRDDGEHAAAVAELTKQLKLARQEVMTLRYRSNTLESVQQRLEEVLKEKKTLEVKLTALEGQLYEQRNRTISGSNFSTTSTSTLDTQAVEEWQRQVEQKQAQVVVLQREVESLRASASDVRTVETRVAAFAVEIDTLCARNEAQLGQIDALRTRIEAVEREKRELEGIVEELLGEMEQTSGGDQRRPPVVDSEPAPIPPTVPTPPAMPPQRSSGNKINALLATFERRGSAPRPVASGKVAHLIRNFSNEDVSAPSEEGSSSTTAKRRSTLGETVKTVTKVDFRKRQGSAS